jgi:hypothetical protein
MTVWVSKILLTDSNNTTVLKAIEEYQESVELMKHLSREKPIGPRQRRLIGHT